MTLTEMEPLRIHLDSNKERHLDALEMAGKMVDKHIIADSNFPSLTNLMRYNVQGKLYITIVGKNNNCENSCENLSLTNSFLYRWTNC